MRKLNLVRYYCNKQISMGFIEINKNLVIYTLELPWKNNKRNISCIPEGNYVLSYHKSPKHGWCYKFEEVEQRDHILIHKGNYLNDTRGCILVGMGVFSCPDGLSLNYSSKAFEFLHESIKQKKFQLKIS